MHLLFEKVARVKGHHSAGRDRQHFTRFGIPPRASVLLSDGKLPKTGNGDWFAGLKGGLEQLQYPIQHPRGFFLRDPAC